jgi:hypothetical protein
MQVFLFVKPILELQVKCIELLSLLHRLRCATHAAHRLCPLGGTFYFQILISKHFLEVIKLRDKWRTHLQIEQMQYSHGFQFVTLHKSENIISLRQTSLAESSSKTVVNVRQ